MVADGKAVRGFVTDNQRQMPADPLGPEKQGVALVDLPTEGTERQVDAPQVNPVGPQALPEFRHQGADKSTADFLHQRPLFGRNP